MKTFIGYVKNYLFRQLSVRALLVTLPLLAGLVYWEYAHNLSSSHLDPHDNTLNGFLRYMGLFALAFLPPLLLGIKKSDTDRKRLWQGLLLIVAGLAIYSLRSSYHEWRPYLRTLTEESTYPSFYYRSFVQLGQALLLGLPVFLVWSCFNRNISLSEQGLKRTDIRPYFLLLVGMIPLVAIASLNADFLKTYPIYQRFLPRDFSLGFTELWQIGFFELCYALDFFSTEYFFRGIMIVGLGRLLGAAVILPMASFYVIIHFGKPLGETISSFFGGMILGILAYETKSIWGGVIIHIGIAWLMELGGSLGRLI